MSSCSHCNFSFSQTSTCVSIILLKHKNCSLFLLNYLLLKLQQSDSFKECAFIFPGKLRPITLGTGIGLGIGYANCQHTLRSNHPPHPRFGPPFWKMVIMVFLITCTCLYMYMSVAAEDVLYWGANSSKSRKSQGTLCLL